MIANFVGSGWVALMSFAFIPVYIHFLGIESYGLIGLFISIQAILSLLDLGLGAAATRQVARLSAESSHTEEMHDLVRTLEWIYWLVGGGIALAILAIAPLAARQWIQPVSMPRQEAEYALVLMGLAFAGRWPYFLYSGVMMGLQRQVLFNTLRLFIETLRSAGAAVVLWLIAPTLSAFLIWNLGVAFLSALVGAVGMRACLPKANRTPRFDFGQIRGVWRYAAGLSGIAVSVVILTQADKLIISRLLDLEQLGYYVLAWATANALEQFVGPVYAAFFPSMAQAVASRDDRRLIESYHRGSQLVAFLLVPLGALLVVLPYEVLWLWTRNPHVAASAALLLSVLAAGTVLHGLMSIPYAMQLAHGWVSLAFWVNVASIVVLIPALIVLVPLLGGLGGAIVWLILNACYVLVTIPLMHNRLFPMEKWPWYRNVVLVPVASCGAIAILAKGLLTFVLSDLAVFAVLALTLGAMFLACALALPRIRPVIAATFARRDNPSQK